MMVVDLPVMVAREDIYFRLMFCPGCTSEYREGYVRCPSCDLDLVQEPADVLLLKIYETSDLARIAAYKSLLDDAGIEYIAENEGVQELFGLGNGAVEFYVHADAVNEARKIGRTLDRNKTETDDDDAFRKACLFIGSILGPPSVWAIYDSWRFPALSILLFALSCGLISKAAATSSDTGEADVAGGSWWRRFVIGGIWEASGVFLGATILAWGWDLVRMWFPSFAASVPVGDESRVVMVLLLMIVWFSFYINAVFRLKHQRRRAAA